MLTANARLLEQFDWSRSLKPENQALLVDFLERMLDRPFSLSMQEAGGELHRYPVAWLTNDIPGFPVPYTLHPLSIQLDFMSNTGRVVVDLNGNLDVTVTFIAPVRNRRKPILLIKWGKVPEEENFIRIVAHE